MIRNAVFAVAAALFATGLPVGAQDAGPPEAAPSAEQSALESRAEEIVGLVNGDIAPAEVFTDAFLAQVPPEQFEAITRQLTGQFGAAIAIESLDPPTGTSGAIAIRMERAIARGSITIDPMADNRISGLLLNEFEPINDSLDKIRADLEALPGDVGAWFGPVEGDAPVLAMNADKPFAIGSTFKFYVLAALDIEIAEGRRNWNDVAELSVKSFPSGMLQDWPEGAPLTLHTLASLMMSISDNTATDQLIAILGCERVTEVMRASGHASPELNTPFLTTRELFLLKGGDPARLAAYRAGSAEQRRAILERLEGEDIDMATLAAAFGGDPVALDVEWLASAQDLRALFRYMFERADPRGFETVSINTALPDSIEEKWSAIGYKGGSEPGVLNLTWLLRDKAGEWHMLSLSWNNPDAPVDNAALETIAQRILSLPH